MPENLKIYEYKLGDHWIERFIHTFSQMAESEDCSVEFHALLGVLRGVKNGNITQGDHLYAEMICKTTMTSGKRISFSQVEALGQMGLFTPNALGGVSARNYEVGKLHYEKVVNKGEILLPPRIEQDVTGMQFDLREAIRNIINFPALPYEAAVLAGVAEATWNGFVRGEANGLVSRGDPYYAQLLFSAAQKSQDPSIFKPLAEIMGEMGFFGKELLLGRLPEKSTAVSRLR